MATKLETGNGIPGIRAGLGTKLDSVGAFVVGCKWEGADTCGVGVTSLRCHVPGVDGSISSAVADKIGVRERVVSSLDAGVAKVISFGTVAIEVVREQTSQSSSRRHHGTCIVADVHEINGVAMAGSTS